MLQLNRYQVAPGKQKAFMREFARVRTVTEEFCERVESAGIARSAFRASGCPVVGANDTLYGLTPTEVVVDIAGYDGPIRDPALMFAMAAKWVEENWGTYLPALAAHQEAVVPLPYRNDPRHAFDFSIKDLGLTADHFRSTPDPLDNTPEVAAEDVRRLCDELARRLQRDPNPANHAHLTTLIAWAEWWSRAGFAWAALP